MQCKRSEVCQIGNFAGILREFLNGQDFENSRSPKKFPQNSRCFEPLNHCYDCDLLDFIPIPVFFIGGGVISKSLTSLDPLLTFPVPTPSSLDMTEPTPKRQWRRWTPEDLEALSDLAGELPWRMVVEQFNQARPPRTPKALTRQAEAMGLSIKPQGEFITTSAITVLTGYNNKKILNWILSGKLKAVYRYKSKNNHWCIS